jgi:glucose-6-phosphate dehydrogenase assembly protein OpcA
VIEVEIGRDELAAVPNIIESLALSELPVFLVWMGEIDPGAPSFERISDAAERIIIDTRRFDEALPALCAYDTFLSLAGDTRIGSDLAWTRLATWRELLAQSFDAPQTAALLPDVSTLEISFEPRAESEALYLAGWFTARLGWQPIGATWEAAHSELTARDPRGRIIKIGMNRVFGSGVGLRAVRTVARSGARTTRVTVRRQGNERSAVDIETAGMPKQRRFVQHLDPPPQDLISTELLAFRRDRIYAEALASAAGYARLCLGTDCEA